MKLETLHNLYIHELQDLHSAEMQIKSALPKAVRAANSDDLKSALQNHLETTKNHVERLNAILKKHGARREEEKCKGMEGLLAECANMLAQDSCEEIYDLGIIAACQRVEHYEMAGYGTARAYAERLGEEDDAMLLAETLEEESTTDDELTSIATMLQSQCDLTAMDAGEGYSVSKKHRVRRREMAAAR
jgi:ferritin-like metal-binding protein YciE